MSHPNGSAEFVYQRLREQILQWQLPPGTAVREAHVAEELGVSRTPVRAALQQLKLEGFLAARGKRGLEVPRWTLEELEETYRLRAHIEEWVGASAARRRERLDLPLLHRLADEMTALSEVPSTGSPR
jgi:DNA-binding GntR family transcriptional regulator